MSSFGADPRLLLGAPAGDFDSLQASVRCPRDWVPTALVVVADWTAVAVAMSATALAYYRFFPEKDAPGFSAIVVYASLCVAAVVVLLLANDGAYSGGGGPLQIKQAEHPVRVAAQTSLLILLLSVVVDAPFPHTVIQISLLTATPLLILEKLLIRRLVGTAGCETAIEMQAGCDDAPNAAGRGYELLKRTFDVIFAAAIIAAVMPLGLIVALLIRLDSGGPVFFRQRRVGKDGQLFLMYKFRSMHADAPMYAVSPNDRTDRRITRVGRSLRMCSVDELPQLLNVIKGEMSLVGPRPEMPFLVEQHLAEHRPRLQVRPGITGLWQLSPARASRIHENPHYDRYYIRNRSFSMDLAILLYTPFFLMRGI